MQEEQRDEVPRINLDSIKQWDRVKANVKEALNEISCSGHLEENEAVRIHLRRWVDLMFEDAKLNIRANGRDLEEYEGSLEETEPYDEILDRRIWTLSKEHIAWDRTLSERRTRTPREIECLLRDLIRRQHEAESAPPERLQSDIHMDSRGDFATFSMDQVLATQKFSMHLATELQQSIPALLERTERAKQVVVEVTRLGERDHEQA